MCQVSRQPGDWSEEVEQDMKLGVDFQSSVCKLALTASIYIICVWKGTLAYSNKRLLQRTLFLGFLLQMLEVELLPGKSLITAMLG